MLRDWEDMCPIQWKSKWIDKNPAFDIDDKEVIRWGIFFETMVIGMGMGGKTVELTPEERKSVLYQRIKDQAKKCKEYLDLLAGKIIGRQQELKAEVEFEGQMIPISGNLDVIYQFVDLSIAIIDLKLAGSTDSTFGKFAWGAPDKMDMSQIIHYKLLYAIVYNKETKSQYWVFDTSPAMQCVPLNVIVSEHTTYKHIERCAKVYNEITESIAINYWEPKNTFKNCNGCPVACAHQRLMPEFIEVNK